MKLKLPNSLYSVDQVLAVAEELHQYGKKSSDDSRGHQEVGDALSAEATALLENLPEAQRTQDAAVEALREDLETLATTAPVVTLVLAVPPPASLKQELTGWLRANVRPQLLVNFHVNPEIAGGIVIRGTNRIFDCSFRTKLMANPEGFTKVLDRV